MQNLAYGWPIIRKLGGCKVFLDISIRKAPATPVYSPERDLHRGARSDAPQQRDEECRCEKTVKPHQWHSGETNRRYQAETASAIGIFCRKVIDERAAKRMSGQYRLLQRYC